MFNKQIKRADQELLYAALCDGEKAEKAWLAWRAGLDFDQSGPRYAPLIPLLHQNLALLGIQDPLMGKFKGIHRRTWYKNQLRLRQVKSLLTLWNDNGIESICLGDITLASHYHTDLGLRPIQAFQFLIHRNQLVSTIQHVQKEGWKPTGKMKQRHIHRFINPEGTRLNLYLHLFPTKFYSGEIDPFWDAKTSIQIHDISAYTLNPIDQLLHLCIQQPQKHFVHPLRIADAMTILRKPQIEFDWERLYTPSLRGYVQIRLYTYLYNLWKKYNAPIPEDVLNHLSTIHPLIRKVPNPILRFAFKYAEQEISDIPLSRFR